MVTSFGFEPPDVVIFPGALYEIKVKTCYLNLFDLPERLMERCCMSGHNLESTGTAASFIKDLVQNSFLLYAIDFVRRLWSCKKVRLLLANEAIV